MVDFATQSEWSQLAFLSDVIISCVYLTIAFTVYSFSQAVSASFRRIFYSFSLFIFIRITSHLLQIFHIWNPNSLTLGIFNLLTTGMAIAVGILFFPLKKKVTAFTQSAKLSEERAEELKKSQAFLDSMIENLPNMVFVKDAETLRFIRFNKAGEVLIGYPRETLIGKNDYDFFPKEQADFFISKDRNVLLGHEIVDIPEEFIETRDKGRRTLHTRKIPIFDSQGKPIYLLGISEDITEWKKAESDRLVRVREQVALEERENAARKTAFLAEVSTLLASSMDYTSTLKRMAELVLPILGDWCTMTVVRNGKNERIVAVHRNSEYNPLLDELSRSYADLHQARESSISKVIETGKTLHTPIVGDADLVRVAIDDRHLEIIRELGCVSCIAVPIASRSRTLGAIVFVSSNPERLFDEQDVIMAEELGRRAAIAIDNAFLYETAQNAIHARNEFLSIASHELKTPITSLKLQVELTRRNTKPAEGIAPTPEKLAKMLDVSAVQIKRLTSLIDDLLDVSRIEAGKLAFNFEEVNLTTLVQETVERYRDHFEASGSTVKYETSDSIFVWGDPFRLEQVVLNILTNATKYGSRNPIHVKVEQTGDAVFFICRDEGIGIASDRIAHIFERFERAISANNISGLGLGLYISYEIVKAHGGSIRAESILGKGTTMIVQLPRRKSS